MLTRNQIRCINEWISRYGHVTILKAAPNPKRPGTVSYDLYEQSYKTLPIQFVDLFTDLDDYETIERLQAALLWDLKHNFITVTLR